MLDRQSKFVSDGFGPLAIDDLPIYIATSIDKRMITNRSGNVLDVISYITSKSGFWRDAEITRASEVFWVAKAPRYQADMPVSGRLELITLWPLEVETVRRGITQRIPGA